MGFLVSEQDDAFLVGQVIAHHFDMLVDFVLQLKNYEYKSIGEPKQALRDLTFSGRVFLYHETELSPRQVADLDDMFSSRGMSLILRGPDYLTQRRMSPQALPKQHSDQASVTSSSMLHT